jgi:outer membrane protein TolC
MTANAKMRVIALLMVSSALIATTVAAEPLNVEQVIDMAMRLSPQVHAARARWDAATHSIAQNYAPADPQVGIASLDSPTNGFTEPSANAFVVIESLQFPGKALLQGDVANRTAEIARLNYQTVVRDLRITAISECYQLAFDQAQKSRMVQTISDLRYMEALTDLTRHKADREAVAGGIADEQQNLKRLDLAIADDVIHLNTLLRRSSDAPLEVDVSLQLEPVSERLDDLINHAWARRQEILQLALASQNAESALELARLQYAPDYTISYAFNHYRLVSDAPAPNLTQTHNISITFNLPLFFWMKQNEDVIRSRFDLKAARDDLEGLRIDTAAGITSLYRHMVFDSEEARLYHDTIIPAREEVFSSAVASYRKNGDYFAELVSARERLRDARSSYLQALGRLLMDRIEMERLVGEPLARSTP